MNNGRITRLLEVQGMMRRLEAHDERLGRKRNPVPRQLRSRSGGDRSFAYCSCAWCSRIVAGLAVQVSNWFLGHGRLLGFGPKLDLDEENNLPNWFSTICLFLCAFALGLIGLVERRGRLPFSTYWLGMAAVFVFLSIDEAASFHEMLIVPLRAALHTSGIFYVAWTIPGILFVVAFLVVMRRFLLQLPAATRRDFVVAGVVFCSGRLGMEMLDTRYHSLDGPDFSLPLMTIVEESLEMAGEILFLRAPLVDLADHVGTLIIRFEKDYPPLEKDVIGRAAIPLRRGLA